MKTETFTIDQGALLRSVVPDRGKPYEHVCSLDAFREVCHAIDALDERSFTGQELVVRTGDPSTQVFTALAFLKERGSLTQRRGRLNGAATKDVYLDGMSEWYALEEG